MSFKFDNFTLDPGAEIAGWIQFSPDDLGDKGVVYMGGHPEDLGAELVASGESQGKNASGFSYVYKVTITNISHVVGTKGYIEGGSLTNLYRPPQGATLHRGETIRMSFTTIAGNYIGPRYLGVRPDPAQSNANCNFVVDKQSQQQTTNGRFVYNVCVTNNSIVTAGFGLQLGEPSSPIDFPEVYSLDPCAADPCADDQYDRCMGMRIIASYGQHGDDHGPQFLSAYPENPGGELVASDESKGRNPDDTIVYRATFKNTGERGTYFHIQGGGVT